MGRRVKTDYHSKGYKHREHRSKKGRVKNHRKKRIWRARDREIEKAIDRKRKKFNNQREEYETLSYRLGS